jgi:hypothetical protein
MGEEGSNQGENSSNLVPSQVKSNAQNNRRGRTRRKPKKKHIKDADANENVNANANENLEDANAQNKSGDHATKKAASTANQKKPDGTDGVKGSKNAKQTKKNKKSNKRKKFLWRKEIPEGTVDPISLEPLNTLSYPPFALMITPPYDPIPVWPIPKEDNSKSTKSHDARTKKSAANVSVDPRKREEQLMSEQWGNLLHASNHNYESSKNSCESDSKSDSEIKIEQPKEETKHFHLFDGRVLAVYLVSTNQFIDPLNRRDLTREEIQNLDSYLAKHCLKKMRVLEAYDEKGISFSTAGSNSQTPSGRLQIRQEEARHLLNSLFGGQQGQNHQQREGPGPRRGVRNGRGGNRNNAMAQQYADHQSGEEHRQSNLQAASQYNNAALGWENDGGIYADRGGLLMIDDDHNPGLRSGLNRPIQDVHNRTHYQEVPRSSSNSEQLASWYGHEARTRADNFPALSCAVPSVSASSTNVQQSSKGNEKPSKTASVFKSLSKISNFVEKTNPKQIEKQRKARELARKKSEIASMAYEQAVKRIDPGNAFDSSAQGHGMGILPVPTLTNAAEPTEAQLERNRNLALALGVVPATERAKLNSGWARPASLQDIDKFGNELNCTIYPDSLIIEARERTLELVRLEKKWLSFLKDDKAASCPLKAMDRPTRKFVHAYSDFWNLHTESFDPQPKRYIHCVKLLETRVPRPLLSEAVHRWRGPAAPSSVTSEILSEQPAGQDSSSFIGELLHTEERVPLELKPRIVPPPGAMFDLEPTNNSSIINTVDDQEFAMRFGLTLSERERKKINLDARTKPLELSKYQPPPSVNAFELSKNYEMARNATKERMILEKERKTSILAAAFASDDEDSDSEWEVEEAVVTGDDEE